MITSLLTLLIVSNLTLFVGLFLSHTFRIPYILPHRHVHRAHKLGDKLLNASVLGNLLTTIFGLVVLLSVVLL